MKVIPKKWADKPELIVMVLYPFIIDFVEGEACFEVLNWDCTDGHILAAAFYKECYAWAKVGRGQIIKKIDSELDRAHDAMGAFEEKYREHSRLERLLEDTDSKMLGGLIEYRQYMWT